MDLATAQRILADASAHDRAVFVEAYLFVQSEHIKGGKRVSTQTAELADIEPEETGQPVVIDDDENDFVVDDRTPVESRPSGTPIREGNDSEAER